MTAPRTVTVVGAGVIGAAIAWNLTRRQDSTLRVLLIDTHLPMIGATPYSAGILRRHHTLPSDVELAAESLTAYRRFREVVGGPSGYTPTGFLLVLGEHSTEDAAVNRKVIDSVGSATELLDLAALRRRFPHMQFAGGEFGVLETDGGYGSAAETALSYRAGFVANGGMPMLGVRVDRVDRQADRWLLNTNIGELATDELVLAAGADTARLGRHIDLQLPVTPRRIGLAVVRTPRDVAAGPVVIDDVTGTYFVPRTDGSVAVGVRARPECPQTLPAEPLTAAEIAEAITRGAQRVPAFSDAPLTGTQAACDGYTPDARPILGPVEDLPGLHLACGFSGGGYKMAPAVGAYVAAGVIGDCCPDRIGPYNVRRFARQTLLEPERPYGYL